MWLETTYRPWYLIYSGRVGSDYIKEDNYDAEFTRLDKPAV